MESEHNQNRSWTDSLIIGKKSARNAVFEIFILLLVAYSCFTTMFYVTFSQTQLQGQIIFDAFVNVMFFLDLVHNYFVEYEDPETFQDVREFKKIAKRYTFSFQFVIDALSTFPWDLFGNSLGILRLLRLFRFPKLIELLDLKKMNDIISSLFEGQQRKEKIMIQHFLMYFYKVFKIIMIASIVTYFMGCIWFIFSDEANE